MAIPSSLSAENLPLCSLFESSSCLEHPWVISHPLFVWRSSQSQSISLTLHPSPWSLAPLFMGLPSIHHFFLRSLKSYNFHCEFSLYFQNQYSFWYASPIRHHNNFCWSWRNISHKLEWYILAIVKRYIIPSGLQS